MSIHQTGPFIAWIVDVLELGGLVVGDGHAPASVPPGSGYVVVYSIPGGGTDGSIDDPRSDASVAVQVTSSSTNTDQTRYLADRVRTILDAAVPAALPTGGRKVIWLDFPEGSPAMNRDDGVQPSRYYIPDRFEMGTA